MLRSGDAHLLLVGDGSERESLRSLAVQLEVQGQVHFAGNVSDPTPYYRLMDVFAMTSDTEQMPISMLEAMATGLPVAATNVGDIVEMVADSGKRFIVPAIAETQLTQALCDLASNSALRAALGADNRLKCIREFSEATMIERYAQCYRTAIDLGGRNRSAKNPLVADLN